MKIDLDKVARDFADEIGDLFVEAMEAGEIDSWWAKRIPEEWVEGFVLPLAKRFLERRLRDYR